MSIARYILVAFYGIYAAIGVYALAAGNLSFVRLGVTAFAIITIVALMEKAGNWAKFGAVLFNAILLLAGLVIAGYGVSRLGTITPATMVLLVVGSILVVAAGSTIWILRRSGTTLDRDSE